MSFLYVASYGNKTVLKYNGQTGAFVKAIASGGALSAPVDVVIDLDGNLLVSDVLTDQVKRYNSKTGAFMGVFASFDLSGPAGMTIHHGVLYVTNWHKPEGVQRFDATTGAFFGQFRPSLDDAHPWDVKVNRANNRLYALYSEGVETFDLTTTASFGLLMPSGSGGSTMAFGPDGNLYISSPASRGVLRYDATTGAFIDIFADTNANGITFGPDNNLYVATSTDHSVLRFNYPTGNLMDVFVPARSGGLLTPFHLTFEDARIVRPNN